MDFTAFFSTYPSAFIIVTLVVGLLIGSFLNVVIFRLPVMLTRDWTKQCRDFLSENEKQGQKENVDENFGIVKPRSRCPHCNALIRAWQNIPVLSFLILRGRCAACQEKISWRYPMVELFTALLTIMVAFHFGWGWPVLAAFVLTWTLIAASGIDYDHQLLPDHITMPLLWLGLLLSLLHGQFDAAPLFPTPTDAVLGAAFGYAILRGVYHLFKLLTGKEGMGFGDFKLLAALGAWFGWQYLLLIILLSAGVGAVVGIALIVFTKHGREKPIPFGPFLAAAGWIVMLWGPEMVDGYLTNMFSY